MNRAMTKKEDTHGYDYHMPDSHLKVNKISSWRAPSDHCKI